MDNTQKEEPLVGPRSHDRTEPSESGLEFDNLYLALLPEDALTADNNEVQDAKNRFTTLLNQHPEEVRACVGKPIDACREILEKLSS